jgi:hypothetical protein
LSYRGSEILEAWIVFATVDAALSHTPAGVDAGDRERLWFDALSTW